MSTSLRISPLRFVVIVAALVVASCVSNPPPRSTTSTAPTSRIDYGRITAVERVQARNPDSAATGALIGGLLGVATGSGQSGSNRALRGVTGAAVGSRVGDSAGATTAFQYTVLIGGTNTIRLVTEQAGLRVGDCVSVERGRFNNIRLAAEQRCDSPAPAAVQEDIREANACIAAKQQLIEAQTDADFDRAERRMRILCNQ